MKTRNIIRWIIWFIVLIFLFIEDYKFWLLWLFIFLITRDQSDKLELDLKELLKHLHKDNKN